MGIYEHAQILKKVSRGGKAKGSDIQKAYRDARIIKSGSSRSQTTSKSEPIQTQQQPVSKAQQLTSSKTAQIVQTKYTSQAQSGLSKGQYVDYLKSQLPERVKDPNSVYERQTFTTGGVPVYTKAVKKGSVTGGASIPVYVRTAQPSFQHSISEKQARKMSPAQVQREVQTQAKLHAEFQSFPRKQVKTSSDVGMNVYVAGSPKLSKGWYSFQQNGETRYNRDLKPSEKSYVGFAGKREQIGDWWSEKVEKPVTSRTTKTETGQKFFNVWKTGLNKYREGREWVSEKTPQMLKPNSVVQTTQPHIQLAKLGTDPDYLKGTISGIENKPVKTAVVFASSVAISSGIGIGSIKVASMTAKPMATLGTISTGGKVLGVAGGVAYGVGSGIELAHEGQKGGMSAVKQKLGEKTSTEIAPAIVGIGIGQKVTNKWLSSKRQLSYTTKYDQTSVSSKDGSTTFTTQKQPVDIKQTYKISGKEMFTSYHKGDIVSISKNRGGETISKHFMRLDGKELQTVTERGTGTASKLSGGQSGSRHSTILSKSDPNLQGTMFEIKNIESTTSLTNSNIKSKDFVVTNIVDGTGKGVGSGQTFKPKTSISLGKRGHFAISRGSSGLGNFQGSIPSTVQITTTAPTISSSLTGGVQSLTSFVPSVSAGLSHANLGVVGGSFGISKSVSRGSKGLGISTGKTLTSSFGLAPSNTLPTDFAGTDTFPKSVGTTETISSVGVGTSSGSSFTSITNNFTSPIPTFLTPSTPTLVPKIPFFDLSASGRQGRASSKKVKQKTLYKPTLTSATLNIRGKPSKFGVMSGFGVRPLMPKKKRRKK